MPMLILGTYRDAEVSGAHPLADTPAQASRHVPVQRLKLGGWSERETAQFIDTLDAGLSATPGFAAALHERTDGHPLFVLEIALYLEESGRRGGPGAALSDLTRLPAGARDIIGTRLNHLSPLCARLLGNAAVIGRRFALDLLVPLMDDASETQCTDALDEARRASLVAPLPEAAQAWHFTHALVREALYDEMPAPRRVRLHLRIAQALEERHRADATPVLSALSYHYFEARSAGDATQAVEYARRAARQAAAALATEEAVTQYRRALQAIDQGMESERCELLLELGAMQTKTSQHQAAIDSFAEAATLARRLKATDAMARAALGYELVSWRELNVAPIAAALVKEALLMGSPLDSPQRAVLLAALTRALVHAGRADASVEVHHLAVAVARRVGDPGSLIRALASIVPAQWETELLPLRLAAGREATAIATHAGGYAEMLFDHCTGWHIGNLMEAGDVDAASQAIAGLGTDEVSIRRQPWLGGVMLGCRSMIALHGGRFDEAERLVTDTLRHATRYQHSLWLGGASVQMFTLRREQGRLGELAPVMDQFRRLAPAGGTWLPGYAVLCCELGRHDEALAAFEQLARGGFGMQGLAINHSNLAYLAEVCAWLGDAPRAGLLYTTIARYAGRNIVFGSNTMCYGAADRLLGMLATTMERWDAAEQHFERAIEVDTASRGRSWLAHTRHQYAAMLLERKRAGDAQRAATLLDAALAGSRELGMRALERRLLALRPRCDAGERTSYPAGLSAREVQVLQMVAEGKTNADIAKALFRSVNTVANHVRNILAKIDAANRAEAAAFAVRHGLTKPPNG